MRRSKGEKKFLEELIEYGKACRELLERNKDGDKEGDKSDDRHGRNDKGCGRKA